MQHTLSVLTRHFLSVDVALIAASWVSAAIGALIYYCWQSPFADKSVRGFVSYVFPPSIAKHPSCRRDYLYAVLGRVTEPLTVGPMLVALPAVSIALYSSCEFLFGPHPVRESNICLTVLILLFVVFVQDFVTWLTHWVEHKSAVMWEVHKVHHSVEFLNPLSNRRHHPWQLVWEGGLNNAAVGVVLGLACYSLRLPLIDNALLGTDAYFFASVLSCYHLRHSHIPLHYGRFERYFLSPSQHQLHHSVEFADWDKNFGLLTSLWDRLFGTISYTKPGYQYRLGLQAEVAGDYDRVWKFWTTPPVNIGKIVWRRFHAVAWQFSAMPAASREGGLTESSGP